MTSVVKRTWQRRWVAVFLLLLTAAAATVVLFQAPPDYTARGELAVLPASQVAGTPKPGETIAVNPYTPGSLGELIARWADRPESHQLMVASGFSADFAVTSSGTHQMFLDLNVSAKSNQAVTATLRKLLELVQAEFVRRQATVRPGELITTEVLDNGEEITVMRRAGTQRMTGVLVAGVLLTLFVSLVGRREETATEQPRPLSSGKAKVLPPLVYAPADSHVAAVSYEDGQQEDNESTVVLPLSGVASGGKRVRG